eukprot:TRINITY_DN1912_c0_g1_i1.p1 TRINITY_DN1912_c0_g1~~TRINITY_DN1912_c0_g1_i1.p1  ORF type:complete len:380 (+),score=92.09 TRINITY_DN1912_c0_g1_i1:116-1255(+)
MSQRLSSREKFPSHSSVNEEEEESSGQEGTDLEDSSGLDPEDLTRNTSLEVGFDPYSKIESPGLYDQSTEEDILSSQESRNTLLRRSIRRTPKNLSSPPCQPTKILSDPKSPPNSQFMHSSPNKSQEEATETKKACEHSCDQHPTEKKGSFPLGKLCFIIGIIILCMGVYLLPSKTQQEPSNMPDRGMENWKANLFTLKKAFPSIKEWVAVDVSARKVFQPRLQPGVLLLMGETSKSVNCFARRLLAAFETSPFDAKDLLLSHPVPNDLKDTLQRQMESYLSRNNTYGLLNIDELSGESAMVFHTFCDNETAPFPRSLIVLTLTVPKEFEVEYAERYIEEYLVRKWTTNLSFDKATSLVNRVIGYSSFIPVESTGPCSA